MGLAKEVFQDIYFCIHQVDGEEAASKLQQFIQGKQKGGLEEKPHKKRHRKSDSLFAYNNAVEDFDDVSSELSLSFNLGDSLAKTGMNTQ